MKVTLSEFTELNRAGGSPLAMRFAEVVVTTERGVLWWKKISAERRVIAREPMGSWYFASDGQFCPGCQAEALERTHRALKVLAAKPAN